MHGRLLVASVFVAGCSSHASDLEGRVHALEAEVASLRATVEAKGARRDDFSENAAEAMRIASSGCKDVSFPSGTSIDVPVAFDVGRSTTAPGDRITIKEIRGTRADFALDGIYLVRGEYTLASAPEATLAFGVGATDPHDACTMNNTRGRLRVARGSGTFELATKFVHRGRPGISFFVDGVDGTGGQFHGAGSGTLRFGKGDFPAE